MEALVPEIISNILGYGPTLDLGRMMRVSRQFNHVLTDSVFLWRDVEIEEPISKKNALETIRTFASRSQHTLQTVWYPGILNLEDLTKISSILEKSKSTLRQIGIAPNVPREDFNAVKSFLISFPNIEELRISTGQVDVPQERVPGRLTVLALDEFPSIRCWSQDVLNKLSSLKTLVIMASVSGSLNAADSGEVQEHCLRSILQKCKSSLNLLRLEGKWTGNHLNCEFPNLFNVCFLNGSDFSQFLISQPPRARYLTGTPIVLGELGFKNLEEVKFWVVGQEEEEVESSLTSLQQMVKICSDSNSTLQAVVIASLIGYEVHSIDFFLRALIPSTSTLCPLLSSLYINEDQIYSFELLAEVMIARKLAAKSRKDSGFKRCSDLTLYLVERLIGRFRDAEREFLSKHSNVNAKKAGLAQVVEW